MGTATDQPSLLSFLFSFATILAGDDVDWNHVADVSPVPRNKTNRFSMIGFYAKRAQAKRSRNNHLSSHVGMYVRWWTNLPINTSGTSTCVSSVSRSIEKKTRESVVLRITYPFNMTPMLIQKYKKQIKYVPCWVPGTGNNMMHNIMVYGMADGQDTGHSISSDFIKTNTTSNTDDDRRPLHHQIFHEAGIFLAHSDLKE